MSTDADFIPPAKGQSAPEVEEGNPTEIETTDLTIAPDAKNVGMAAVQGVARWVPDLDAIEGVVQRALALFPAVDDPPPLVKDFQSPVFWATTVVPIVLAVAAYLFHQDLSSLAVSMAALGAAITTLGYTVYRGIYRHAHAHAHVVTTSIRANQVTEALSIATTGQLPGRAY